MSRLSVDEIARLDELQSNYIVALDTKNMAAWVDTFDEDPGSSYVCTSRDNDERDLRVAMMLDDCRDRLIDRGTFIESIWAGTFQDYRTRHFVQRVRATRRTDGMIDMLSHFSVVFTPDDTGVSELLAAGTYEDVVCLNDEGATFRSRRALTDTAVLPRYLVFPL